MPRRKLCLRPTEHCRRCSGTETQTNVLPISWRRPSQTQKAEQRLLPIQSHQTIRDCSYARLLNKWCCHVERSETSQSLSDGLDSNNQRFFASLRMTRPRWILEYAQEPALLLPFFRQLLFECLHWLEQVPLFFDARHRLIGTKP